MYSNLKALLFTLAMWQKMTQFPQKDSQVKRVYRDIPGNFLIEVNEFSIQKDSLPTLFSK